MITKIRKDAGIAPAWRDAYRTDSQGIHAGWRGILGPLSFPRDVLVQLPQSRDPETGKKRMGRYDVEVRTFQEYAKVLLENAPRRDMWVGWSRPQDYERRAMHMAIGDVDSSGLKEAHVRARRYEEFAMTEFDVQPASLFTCGKGFHSLLSHDEVPYRGRAYSDAMLRLSDPYRVYLDAQPLKSRTAKPRMPYSINLKATGREMAPMFVVPVDLSWDLKEIIQAAKECRVTPFKIPHSKEAAKLITPLAEQNWNRIQRAAKRRIEAGTGANMERIRSVVEFCQENGPFMVDERGLPDGRRRMLLSLLVPALMHLHQGDEAAVLEEATEWVQACRGSWEDYEAAVDECVKNIVMDDGEMRQPTGLVRWLGENPGLRFPRP